MFNLMVGLVIGWLAGSWYSNKGADATRVVRLKARASTAIEESQRLVAESRRDLQEAVAGAGRRDERQGRQRRARRGKGAPGNGEAQAGND